jgi:hypothetical protein
MISGCIGRKRSRSSTPLRVKTFIPSREQAKH